MPLICSAVNNDRLVCTCCRIERIWEDRNRTPVLFSSGAIIVIVAPVDWWTKPYVSLGFLYLFPILFAAAFLPRWAVSSLGAGCAILTEVFSSLPESLVRLGFETLAGHWFRISAPPG